MRLSLYTYPLTLSREQRERVEGRVRSSTKIASWQDHAPFDALALLAAQGERVVHRCFGETK